MLLKLNTDKLDLVTSASGDIDIVVTYIDRDDATGVVGVAQRQFITVLTATTADIVDPHSSGISRKVTAITVRNAHATISNDVLVRFNASGTIYELFAARLYPTEMLQYAPHTGFKLVCRDPNLLSNSILQAFSTINTGTSPVAVGELQTPKTTKTVFGFLVLVFYDTAINTTGILVGSEIYLPSGVTSNFYRIGFLATVTNSVTGATLAMAATQDTVGPLTVPDTSAVGFGIWAGGFKLNQANPAIPLQIGSEFETEVAGSLAEILRGSSLQVFSPTN